MNLKAENVIRSEAKLKDNRWSDQLTAWRFTAFSVFTLYWLQMESSVFVLNCLVENVVLLFFHILLQMEWPTYWERERLCAISGD